MKHQPGKRQGGFTIVELLIVIVVIGILAAITIVAYNGIQNKARATQYQSDAAAIDGKIEAYGAVNSSYPLTAAGTDAATVVAQTTAGAALTTTLNGLAESKLPANMAIFAVIPYSPAPTYTQALAGITASATVNQYFVSYCTTGKGTRIWYADPSTSTVKSTDVGVCP
jgi:prepilin-type N-terminal cleavage/methylation domain-containing protein